MTKQGLQPDWKGGQLTLYGERRPPVEAPVAQSAREAKREEKREEKAKAKAKANERMDSGNSISYLRVANEMGKKELSGLAKWTKRQAAVTIFPMQAQQGMKTLQMAYGL